jgi:hypothetical protein
MLKGTRNNQPIDGVGGGGGTGEVMHMGGTRGEYFTYSGTNILLNLTVELVELPKPKRST